MDSTASLVHSARLRVRASCARENSKLNNIKSPAATAARELDRYGPL